MTRRTLGYVALAIVGLAGAVAASTLATVTGTRPDEPCTDRRWGCSEFEPGEPIVIGALLPTSGESADLGSGALRSAMLAVEEAEPIFGHDIVLDARDDACDPEPASAAARRFGTSESPTRPPTAAVIGGVCRPTVEPAAQILSDTGVPFVTWYQGELRFAEPFPRVGFLIRVARPTRGLGDPNRYVGGVAAALVIDAIREVAIQLEDGTVLVPRTQLRDVLRRATKGPALEGPHPST